MLGSVRYASINCHNHKDLGRRDDIWSWLYSVVEMQIGTLPWSAIEDENEVAVMKICTKRNDLLKHMESAYQYIYKNLKQLKYESRPSYKTYKEKLRKVLRRRNITENSKYDWEKKKKKSRPQQVSKQQKYHETELAVTAVVNKSHKSKKEAHSI